MLFGAVQDVIEHLNDRNTHVGEPDGLPYVDVLFEEVIDHVNRTGGCLINHHMDQEEFASIHHPESGQIRAEIYALDPDWYEFGAHTSVHTPHTSRLHRSGRVIVGNNPDKVRPRSVYGRN